MKYSPLARTVTAFLAFFGTVLLATLAAATMLTPELAMPAVDAFSITSQEWDLLLPSVSFDGS